MEDNTDSDQILTSVKEYYGKHVKTVDDLQTQAVVASGRKTNELVKDAISLVHEAVACKYYGCGLVMPEKLEGLKILDLGCGSGRDCYVLSKLVGPTGHVTGIDMTDEQLDVAREYIDYHTQKFGYTEPNVNFVKGYIENLTKAGIRNGSYDIVVSNCVVNLCPDKRAVLQESFNALKAGGELFFCDIYADRPLDESVRKHKLLWGEGFAGALWWRDLHSIGREVGFSKPYMFSASPIPVDREDFREILGDTKYASVTYRLLKLSANKEEGTYVVYKGNIPGYEKEFKFDHKTHFKKNEALWVGSTTVTALKHSRFLDDFEFQLTSEDESTHCCEEDEAEDPFVYLRKEKN